MKHDFLKYYKTGFFFFLLILLTGSFNSINAQISLPSVFTDNMVLQQNFDAPVWGWAKPGTKIIVSGNWSRMPAQSVIADKDGKWSVKLKTLDAGGPFQIQVNDVIIKNVMIGEVWICSGQSNMQWALSDSEGAEQELKDAEMPSMRLFYVARDHADSPTKDCYGKWEECTAESAKTFSAVAYYFGKELHKTLDVPVGLIHVSWGGSPAQAWINDIVLQSTHEGNYYIEKYKDKVANANPGINPRDHKSPSGLYNAMLNPLIPFAIRGAVWYQGEANTNEHSMYKNLLESMIGNWRDEWGQGEFPFYFVQLAPFNYQKEVIGAALRDQQRMALETPNTGMAVTLDIGDPDDIHPLNKKDVGHRLSLWALAKTYGKEELVHSGPLYKSMQKEGKKIRLFFDHPGSGLVCNGKDLTHFTIAGKDKIFYSARAHIENNDIVVFNKKLKNPVAVRFAFNNGDEPNLLNAEGLPASTFRTDNWRIITETALVKSEYDQSTDGFIISMESIPESEIRYTLNGTEPSINSLLYTEPFTTTEDTDFKVRVFVDGEPSLLTTVSKIQRHLATGKSVEYEVKYNERYTAGGNLGLVNSLFGSTDFRDGNWQGFHGDDLEIVIDLEIPTEISSVGVSCLQISNSWIVFPKQVDIYVSDDGLNFTKTTTANHEIPVGLTKELNHLVEAKFEGVNTRYVKVVARNYGPLPEWHQSAGNEAWLFVDEVIVE